MGNEPSPVLTIDTHEGLAAARQEIIERLHANPDIARLLLINPIAAFQDVGVQLSPELASHILHTLQFAPETAARRRVLETDLRRIAGERPRSSDPQWVSHFLFQTLQLKPLATTGAQPRYKPVEDPEIAARQLRSLPKLATGPKLQHPDHGTAIVVQTIVPGVRHLDLDTPAPSLPTADSIPEALDLTALYFYKDTNPAARDLLELGIIDSQATQVGTPDTYRKVKNGESENPWGNWVNGITFTAPE
jgi:hypothetical protein